MDNEQNESIEELCRSLKSSHPLRQEAMALLSDPAGYTPHWQPIVKALATPSLFWQHETAVVLWLIRHGNWSDNHRTLLSEMLSKAIDRAIQVRRPGYLTGRWFLRGLFITYPFAMWLVLDGYHPLGNFGFIDLIFCHIFVLPLTFALTIASSVILLPLSIWVDSLNLRQFRPAIQALDHLGQPDSLASLARASLHHRLKDVAASALATLTDRLQPSDYGTLPPQTIPALCRALNASSPQTDLVILRALGVIGDERAIESVERLLRREILSEVRASASSLLPILKQRALENQAPSLLLRASHPPEESGQTLLRAVWERPNTDPTQLLRAALADGDEGPGGER